MKQILLFAFLLVFSISFAQKPLNAPNGIKSGSTTLTPTEISYLGNFTSDGQAQLNAKPDTSEVNLRINNVNPHDSVYFKAEIDAKLTSIPTLEERTGYSQISSVLGYWNLNQNSNTLTDSKGVNNATNSGGIVNQTGILDKCVTFDTNTDYVSIANSVSIVPTGNQLSLACWVYMTAYPSSYSVVLGMWDWGITGSGASIVVVGDNSFRCSFRNTSGAINTVVASSSITLNQWYYVVAVNDDIAPKIYINGILSAISASAWSGTLFKFTDKFMIGNEYEGASSAITGSIDEIAIYNKALSANEILYNYSNGVGRTYPFMPN